MKNLLLTFSRSRNARRGPRVPVNLRIITPTRTYRLVRLKHVRLEVVGNQGTSEEGGGISYEIVRTVPTKFEPSASPRAQRDETIQPGQRGFQRSRTSGLKGRDIRMLPR